MASAAAMKMYNSLSPSERAAVDASIQGNPNGIDDWYQAAAEAGDPRAIRAGGEGQSEDFGRFNEGTITGWAQQYYDAAASRAAGRPQFRSMRGAPGFFDKPTECPPGSGPSGPNESDPCTTKGYSEPATGQGYGSQGGSGGQGQGGQMYGGSWMGYSPLRDLLANQGGYLRGFDANPGDNQAGIKGGVMGGGGIWYSPTQGSSPQWGHGGGGGNPLAPVSPGDRSMTAPRAGATPTVTPGGNPWERGMGMTPRTGTTPLVTPGGNPWERGMGMDQRSQPGSSFSSPLTQAMTPLQGSTGLTGSLLQPQTGQLTSVLQAYQPKKLKQTSWF